MFDFTRFRSLGYIGGTLFGGMAVSAIIYTSVLYNTLRISSVIAIVLYIALITMMLISILKKETMVFYCIILFQVLAWLMLEITFVHITGHSTIPGRNMPVDSILKLPFWEPSMYIISFALIIVAILLSKPCFIFLKKRQNNKNDMEQSKKTLMLLSIIIGWMVVYESIRYTIKDFPDIANIVIFMFLFLCFQTFSFVLFRYVSYIRKQKSKLQ